MQQLLGSNEEQVPAELGAPGSPAAALGCVRAMLFAEPPWLTLAGQGVRAL